MKLSVIIPVYNTEKYLRKCLESVFNQDLPLDEYEIICINDGSTDHSENILLEFAEKYSNLIYIKQENQGVSIARNQGLDKAKGNYITFLDADDFLEKNILQDIITTAEKDDLDLLYLKMTYVDEEDKITGEFKMNSEEVSIQDGFTHQRRGFIVSLYKREIIGDLRFVKDIIIAEDALFNIMIHTFAKRVSYYPKYSYYYRQHNSSSFKNVQSQKTFDGMIKNIYFLHEFVEAQKMNLTDEQLKYYNRPFYLLAKMTIESNIIPLISLKRLRILKETLNNLQLKHTKKQIKKDFFWFDMPNWIFYLLYKTKSIIK